MDTLRMLVTGRTESQVLCSLRRATSVLDDEVDGHCAEVVVLTRWTPRDRRLVATIERHPRVRHLRRRGGDAELLDAGLFLRPLPATVAVVGERGSTWVPDIAPIGWLLADAGVGAVVVASTSVGTREILRDGGVFAAAALCTAGGFAPRSRGATPGGERSLVDRLDALGYATVTLPEPPSPASSAGGALRVGS